MPIIRPMTASEFENETQKEKFKLIQEYWSKQKRPTWLMLRQIFDYNWLNTDVSLDEVKADLDYQLSKIRMDLETIKGLPNEKAAVEDYKITLNINSAIMTSKKY